MQYETNGGMVIQCHTTALDYTNGIEFLSRLLDSARGALYSSSFEYPGRYTHWDVGFVNPALVLESKGLDFSIKALNPRGEVLLAAIFDTIKKLTAIAEIHVAPKIITGRIQLTQAFVPEEQRSRQPSLFSVIRSIIQLFSSEADEHLGLYGAFGYDCVFQFEQLEKKLPRNDEQRDLVLYLPDEIYVMDHRKETLLQYQYEFSWNGQHTAGLERTGEPQPYSIDKKAGKTGDHAAGEYAAVVRLAKEKFKKGDLFEVVPGQTFFENYDKTPSELFNVLKRINPAPYGFMINLGEGEFLVGASPEMYVCVQGRRVETCPISGTIKRGKNPIEDAKNIQTLLNSPKEESELTMCTDVDRNDKSRICEPGSVQVIGRRQIEMYSRLIHTVDHVEGRLRPEFDALDAFLSHMWVVTVTGAPKLWAMQFIEDHEKTPRRWYAGSVGWLGFDGDMNTGLTLRTIRLQHGIAEIRAGATLLYDSVPEAEEQETRLKASALIGVLRGDNKNPLQQVKQFDNGKGKRVLLVDHQDSFVHTLANYLRQTGAEVMTLRSGFSAKIFQDYNPDLVVLSPGPGSPKDFNTDATIALCLQHKKPIFGVCLGLQAMVEYCGGVLSVLDYPMHGKADAIVLKDNFMFRDIATPMTVGRYHSLYIHRDNLPKELVSVAETTDGIVMALTHQSLPLCAVQFHPESILTLENGAGLQLIANVWGVCSV